MPVEIVILSGVQQGTHQVFDRSEFRVGCQPICDVKFDPLQDRSAADREAFFRLTDEGWTVSSTGLGEMFLNQQPLTRTERVRSGDVLRMSNQGPDLAFNILLRAPATAKDAAPPAGLASVSATSLADKPSRGAPPASVVPRVNGMAMPTAASAVGAAAPGLPVGDRSTASPRTDIDAVAASALMRPTGLVTPVRVVHPGRLFQGLAGLGILVVIVVLLPQWRPANRSIPTPQSSAGEKPDVIPPVFQPTDPDVAGPISPTAAKPTVSESPPEHSDPRPLPALDAPPPTASAAEDLLKGTVFLIELELRQRRMPFANGVAISDKLVLTSAQQAVQLARWRKQGVAEKIWVVDHDAKVEAEVQDIRVFGDCAAIPADSPNWIYCNLALLTVAPKLPKRVALATPQDLEKLKEGATVYCLGTPHEGVPLSDPEELRPLLKKCRIHFVTVASELSSKPRLLHLKAELPQNLFGSPVVNKVGQLVGVYGRAAVAPEQDATPEVLEMLNNLHYAPAISAAVMEAGLTGSPGKSWVAAESVPSPQSEAPR